MRNFLGKNKLHILVLLLSLGIGASVSVILGQDLNWDLLNYHYYNAWAFLHNGLNNDIAPGQFQSYGNPIIDLLSYFLISYLKPIIASSILASIQGLNIFIVFEISFIVLRRFNLERKILILVSLSIAILSFFGAGNISEVGNSMGDSILSILILGSFLVMLISIGQQTKKYKKFAILLSFCLMGLAMGLKLTSAIYFLPLLICAILIEKKSSLKFKNISLYILTTIISIFAISGFWYLKMWNMFRNPIFPYYNKIFKSQFYFDTNFTDSRWFPHTILGKIFYPFVIAKNQNQAAEIPFSDPRLSVLFVLIIILLAYKLLLIYRKKENIHTNKPDVTQRVFWIFIILSYLLWEKQFSYYRYAIPIELLSLLAISIIIYSIANKYKKIASIAIVITLLVITINTNPINWGRISWQKSYFGIELPAELPVKGNSTILMAGYGPYGFLVSAFPKNVNFIRVQSNMSDPASGAPTEEIRLIKNKIDLFEKNNNKFFAIEIKNEIMLNQSAISNFGYINDTCLNIKSYPNTYIFHGNMQYVLCSLKKIKTN